MKESLETLCKHGAKIIRCDAFGYCTKKRGTRCFFEVLPSTPIVWDGKTHEKKEGKSGKI